MNPSPLQQLALASIRANLVETTRGTFVAAGSHQFKSLWVRDFCYSVPGLLRAGYTKMVEAQLNLILSYRRSDHLLPRGIDVINPKLRVVWQSLCPRLPMPIGDYRKGQLRPEFEGEHSTPAFDSNLLFLRAHSMWRRLDQNGAALPKTVIRDLLSVYTFDREGLIGQPAFSDWQDSVRRRGPLLLTQLLYLSVLLEIDPASQAVERLRAAIERHFYDRRTGLYFETLEKSQYSLDSHWLLLTEPSLLPHLSHKSLYSALKAHPLWGSSSLPGIPVEPRHRDSEVSWTTKVVGLRHYHDGFHWGWLMAAAYQICKKMGDLEEARRLLEAFERAHQEGSLLAEIYEFRDGALAPVKKTFYRSETPFTWTAAAWLAALS